MNQQQLIDLLKKLISNTIDCLESCVDSITIANGKRMVKVFFLAVLELLVVSITGLLGIFTIISWQEALMCVLLSGVLCLADSVNQNAVKKIKRKVRGESRHGNNRGQQSVIGTDIGRESGESD